MVELVDLPAADALTGICPVSAVLLVVAADSGWMPQSSEHLAALHALGIRQGLLVVTRSDLADPLPTLRRARAELAGTSLAEAEPVVVSGLTGEGIPELRNALDRLADRMPLPDPAAAVRLWVDETAGTVVTGTLPVGTLHTGDELVVAPTGRRVRIESLESLGQPMTEVTGAGRVALKVDGINPRRMRRGQALVALNSWRFVSVIDVRLKMLDKSGMPARELVLHIGSAGIPAHVRHLGPSVARLTLRSPLPLRIGDSGLLHDPQRHLVVAGVTVLDILPPDLRLGGAMVERAVELSKRDITTDGMQELRRRGMVRRSDLVAMGCTVPRAPSVGEWLFDPDRFQKLRQTLLEAVREYAARHPEDPAMPKPIAAQVLGLPDRRLVEPLARASRGLGVRMLGGRLVLGPRDALEKLIDDLAMEPFAAPEQPRLNELGLTAKRLNAAVARGMLIRLADGVYLRPDSIDLAKAVLTELPETFTVAEVRTALRTSRRVAVPLLELLDARGVTERLDASQRRLRKGRRS
ncbi:SelB C-terminal domain-containing protein [Kibdelosporangium philippinense]|uniref:SelB C-terminal domain-containing protein n=2 Tax=Kibdelosporangium philippinense TaxID=211113 RepID=A0ABS8Z6S8_9PSEU|nr:selenocysteine-specific translation elongation factor [Kibdelosporangium philippinense]MCE7002773.1 SelB C-terminal domain-containing protein [Kibdelosporangium philippinense]